MSHPLVMGRALICGVNIRMKADCGMCDRDGLCFGLRLRSLTCIVHDRLDKHLALRMRNR